MRRALRLSRRSWPIRVRLTVAFASVIALVLAACGLLIYVQFSRFLDTRTNEELADRAVAVTRLAAGSLPAQRVVDLSSEPYAQIYGPGGRLEASARRLGHRRLLDAAQLAAARRGAVTTDRPLPGAGEEGATIRAFPLGDGRVAVIGEARIDRDRGLDRLAALLLLSLPGALLLASLTGYQVAGAALRPVEEMRRRAASIGESDLSERLGEPGTHDELDRLAHTLNALLERLQDALARERRIVGDASHELRTPLSVLRTRIDVALRGDGDEAALRAVLAEAQVDAGRLSRLADDLLVLARADQGRLPLRLGPVEVQELLERAAERHHAAAERAGRSLAVAVEIEGGAVLLADPDRLDQMLDNLIVNSLRYGAGAIELTAVPSRRAGPSSSCATTAPAFRTASRPGPSSASARPTRAAASEGHGLGLAIVDAIARALGGRARARTHPDGGAEVRLELPLA